MKLAIQSSTPKLSAIAKKNTAYLNTQQVTPMHNRQIEQVSPIKQETALNSPVRTKSRMNQPRQAI